MSLITASMSTRVWPFRAIAVMVTLCRPLLAKLAGRWMVWGAGLGGCVICLAWWLG